MDPIFNPSNKSRYAMSLQGANLLLNASRAAKSNGGDGDNESEDLNPSDQTALASLLELGVLYSRAKMQGFIDKDDGDTLSSTTIPKIRNGLNAIYTLKSIASPLVDELKKAGIPLHEAFDKKMDIGMEDTFISNEADWLSRLQLREMVASEEGDEVEKRYWASFGKRYYLGPKGCGTRPNPSPKELQDDAHQDGNCECQVCLGLSTRFQSLSAAFKTERGPEDFVEESQETTAGQDVSQISEEDDLHHADGHRGVGDGTGTVTDEDEKPGPEPPSPNTEWNEKLGNRYPFRLPTPWTPEGWGAIATSPPEPGDPDISAFPPPSGDPEFPGGSIIVEVNGDALKISPGRLFTFFWRNIPAGPCEVCWGDFDDERGPPIRTMSAGPGRFIMGGMTNWPDFYIRVHNRHLECIEKHQIPIIPVSHVWNEGISRANIEQGVNGDAIYEVFFRPIHILQRATLRFPDVLKRPVEIWHDYFSVPQFNHDIQERLLLALPDIYRVAPFILVHLDDISNDTIRGMFPAHGEDNAPSMMRRLDCISNFFSAHWFKRMWTNLEYTYSQRACILTSDHHVLYWDGAELTRDPFALFRDHAVAEAREIDIQMSLILPPHLHAQFQKQKQSYTTVGPSTYRRLQAQSGYNLNYCEALQHISTLECRSYRDRFIAMAGMLSIGSYRDTTLTIPKDAAAACLWVAQECLRRGDYSPLLLTPMGETPLTEARWLVGHEKMSPTMCYLGRRTHEPKNLSIIEPGTDQIRFTMQYVGEVILSWHVEFCGGDDFINFCIVAEEILATTGPNAREFVAGILRVYCVPLYMADPEIPRTYEEYEALEHDFTSQLESLLREYADVVEVNDNNEIIRIAEEMIGILRLTRPYRSNMHTKNGPFTRLLYAGSFSAAAYYRDSIDVVECARCERGFVYRLYHYTSGKHVLNARVYRIQGLGYEGTLPDGVGLIVKDGKVVGKMVYGTPACPCEVMRSVNIS